LLKRPAVKVREVEPKLVFSRASAVNVSTAALHDEVKAIAEGLVTFTVGFDRYVVGIVCPLSAASADSYGEVIGRKIL